jgi:hypothetical protein
VQRLGPFAREIDGSLRNGAKAEPLAYRLAALAGVTPGQAMLYIWSKRYVRQLSVTAGNIIEIPQFVGSRVRQGPVNANR